MDSLPNPNTTPALQPPEGVIPNFVNPPTIAPSLVAGLAVMCGVTTLGFAARMFTKTYVMKDVRLEDYTLIFGWAFSIIFNGFLFAQAPFSIGRNQWNVNLTQMAVFLEYVNLTELFYSFCMFFTKLAILIQLKSIFRGASRDWIYWLFVSLMAFVGVFYFATAAALIAQCVPREKIGNPLVPGICIDSSSSAVSSGAFNFALDCLIFTLPIYAIYRLNIKNKRKIGICAVFAIGLLACIASCFRLYYSIQLVAATNLTYGMVNLCWCAALEVTSAILVACFPVMPRLYRFLRGDQPDGERINRYQPPENGYPSHGQTRFLNTSERSSSEKPIYRSQSQQL